MYKRIMKYGKWFAILYVAQAMVGVGIGLYSVWSGSNVFGLDLIPGQETQETKETKETQATE